MACEKICKTENITSGKHCERKAFLPPMAYAVELAQKLDALQTVHNELQRAHNALKLENEVLLQKVILLAKALPAKGTEKPTLKELPRVK